MMVSMARRVVVTLTTLVVFAAGTAFGAQPCLTVDKVSYNGPEASRYLETGVSQMVESRLTAAGVALKGPCDVGTLAIRVTLFGGTANLSAQIDKAGYHFNRSGSESELIGFVQALGDEVVGVATGTQSAPPAPAPVKTTGAPAAVSPDVILRSEVFPLAVQSVAVGDLNGDGRPEAVAVSRGVIQLLSVSAKAIEETARVALPDYVVPVRLDIADLDGDGKPEVLLSALHAANQSPLACVYRFKGTSLVQVGKEAPFLTAVVTLPGGGGRGCIGQRIDGIDYWGDLQQVRLGEKGLELAQPLKMDAAFKVLGWDRAPGMKAGDSGLFRLSDEGRLEFWKDPETKLFRGDEEYGGSLVFLSKVEGSKKREARRYLVSRVQAVDGGGLKGVAVLQTENALGSLFQGLRRYKSGHVTVVSWNGYELSTVAATAPVKGFVSDFALVDVDGDGTQEAFCSVLNTKGGISGKSRSYFLLSPLK